MATGNGPSLGSALSAAFRAAGATRGGPAKGWHAQLSALTRTKAGQERLLAAGIEPGRRAENWRAWLSESRTPRPATRALIEQAYRGGLPPSVKTATVQISGPIVTEDTQKPHSESTIQTDGGTESTTHGRKAPATPRFSTTTYPT